MHKGLAAAAVTALVSACAVERPSAPPPGVELGRESLLRGGDDGRGINVTPSTGAQRPLYTSSAYLPDGVSVLPPAPEPPEQDRRLAAMPSVTVSTITLANSTLPPDATARIIAPYEHRSITSTELQNLRRQLSSYYYDEGYVNSGVVIPDQQIVDGVVRLEAVEGGLSAIQITGNRRLSSDYLAKRVEPSAQKPLNVRNLQQALTTLQREPLVRQINARLDPGLERGDSTLSIHVTENRPWQLSFIADNEVSPSVGSERAILSVTSRSLSGRGDALNAQVRVTDGLDGAAVAYTSPLNARGTLFSALYEVSDALVIEAPFDQIDIKNESDDFEAAISHPLRRLSRLPVDTQAADRSETRVTGSLGLGLKHSETSLLDVPFSFSPGVQDGVSDVTALRAGLDWFRRSRDTALSFGGAARIGLDAFGATINDDGTPDSRFLTWQAQGQYARRVGFLDGQIIWRAFAQLAGEPLLPLEKLSIGGFSSVRGYRENRLVRDNGVVTSFEFHIPLGQSRIRLTPFADYGRSWDEDDALPTSVAETISSVGLGLQWSSPRGFIGEVFYGNALESNEPFGDDLQDDGIHFRFSYTLL